MLFYCKVLDELQMGLEIHLYPTAALGSIAFVQVYGSIQALALMLTVPLHPLVMYCYLQSFIRLCLLTIKKQNAEPFTATSAQ